MYSILTQLGNLEVAIDSTYTKTETDTLLASKTDSTTLSSNVSTLGTAIATKQNALVIHAGDEGVPVIDPDNSARNIIGVPPVNTLSYFNPLDPEDSKNNHI